MLILGLYFSPWNKSSLSTHSNEHWEFGTQLERRQTWNHEWKCYFPLVQQFKSMTPDGWGPQMDLLTGQSAHLNHLCAPSCTMKGEFVPGKGAKEVTLLVYSFGLPINMRVLSTELGFSQSWKLEIVRCCKLDFSGSFSLQFANSRLLCP